MHVPLSQADMVTDEFRELNKETTKTLVERERKKKEKSSTRKERKRERGRESERAQENRAQENRRARFLAMAFWRRSDNRLYTAQGPFPPLPHLL